MAAPAAHAANITYVNNLSTAEGVVRQSKLQSTLTGGNSSTYTAATSYIVSFNPAPGYREHGSAASTGSAKLSHPRVSNAYSKCYWYLAGRGGSTTMSCSAKT